MLRAKETENYFFFFLKNVNILLQKILFLVKVKTRKGSNTYIHFDYRIFKFFFNFQGTENETTQC